MSEISLARVDELVAEAVDELESNPGFDIEAFVHAHPAEESTLRERISKLRLAGLLPPSSTAAPASATPSTNVPPVAGFEPLFNALDRKRQLSDRYELRGEIGHGGMGRVIEVYDRELRRTLAMKVLQLRGPLALRAELVARFLEEAQVTAQLDHPGIVPVHELGFDEHGDLFFTMRLIHGRTLGEVFDASKHGDRDWTRVRVLDAILRACEALAYAHDRGVIHRDLKPANIMVGAFGEVYVMDWGLAKLRDAIASDDEQENTTDAPVASERHEQAKDSPFATAHGRAVGTPVYMPPEQARGEREAIDTRSDVYAMGAILYHFLSGAAPYTRSGPIPRAQEQLAHVIAGPPASIETLAPHEPAELLAICAKAMSRDTTQRYPSISELAADLRAFVERRVVRAYETGAWAEARKWVQRNRGLAVASAAAVSALIAGLIISIAFYRTASANAAALLASQGRLQAKTEESQRLAAVAQASAAQARRETERADAKAEEATTQRIAAEQARDDEKKRANELKLVSDFQSSMYGGIDVELMGVRLREDVLKEARAAMRRSKRDETEIAERMQQIEELLAGSNFTNAAVSSVESNVLQHALTSIDTDFVKQPAVQAQLLNAVGLALESLGRYEAADEPITNSVALLRELRGDDDLDTIAAANTLAVLLSKRGRFSDAEPLYRDALEHRSRVLGDDHPDTIMSESNLAELRKNQGFLNDSERLYRDALARRVRVLGDDHPDTLASKRNLASLLQARGKLSEAEPMGRDALERTRRVLGDDHPDTIHATVGLADVIQARGQLSDAEPLYREALERSRRVLGDDHPDTIRSTINLAALLTTQGHLGDAESLLRDALVRCHRILGDDHQSSMGALIDLAVVLQGQGKLVEAEQAYREAVERFRRIQGDDHPDTIKATIGYATLLQARGKLNDAELLCRDALERSRRVLGDDHSDTIWLTHNLASLLHAEGKLSEAEPLYRDALDRFSRTLGEDHVLSIAATSDLGWLLQARGQYSAAEPLYRDALQRYRQKLGVDHPSTITATANLASLLRDEGKLDEAEPLQRDALERSRRILGDDHPTTLTSTNNLASLLQAQGKLGDAESLLRDLVARCHRTLGDDHAYTIGSTNNFASLLQAQGKFEEAEPLYRDSMVRRHRLLGEDHPDTIRCASNLGTVLVKQGKLSEAEPLLRDALDRRRRVLGDQHPDTLSSMANLGALLTDTSAFAEAESLLLDCEQGSLGIGDAASSMLKTARMSIVRLYDAMEQVSPAQGYAAKAEEYRVLLGDAVKHPR